MIDAKHPRAVAVYEEFNKMPMPPSPQLKDADIDNILAYIESRVGGGAPAPQTNTGGGGSTGAGNTANGKVLFGQNCSSCHAPDMKTKATGPALGEGVKNWADYPREDLYKWIRNSQEMVAANHPRAVAVFAEFNKAVMNPMNHLKDQDIEDILAFIAEKYESKGDAATTTATGGGDTGKTEQGGGSAIWWVLLVVLVVAVALVGRYINSLTRLAQQKNGEHIEDEKSVMEILLSRGTRKVLIYLIIIIGGYNLVNAAVGIGRQQGYKPEQPIKYSHELHAGQNKIECQYCHDGARRSKHAIIPATNTCMNCHKLINKGPKYGTGEILKIYASAGFNPASGAFFDKTVTAEQRKEVYQKWVEGHEVMKDKSEVERANLAKDQVAAAAQFIDKPVEWVRIHNLPDHVYFNHAQHVTVGKIECQTCHGKIETMEVVEQYATLSMGWCINCHRQTNVQFSGPEGNKYYETYERYHRELQSGERTNVKVEDIGGLDCQKCHY